jgi:hypothetical protein
MNESTGISGHSRWGSFYIEKGGWSIRSLNSSSNTVQEGSSGIYANGEWLVMQYCHFGSDSAGSVIELDIKSNGTFDCLEFVNCSAVGGGLIHGIGLITFRDSLFVANQMQYLVAGTSPIGAVFLRCIFDQYQFWIDHSFTFITESCEVRDRGTISLDHGHCPLDTGFAPISRPLSTAAEIGILASVSVVSMCLGAGVVLLCWKKKKICFKGERESELHSSLANQSGTQ